MENKQWYNATTGEGPQSADPWGNSWVSESKKQEYLDQGWEQVEDGFVPPKSLDQVKQEKLAEIQAELSSLDAYIPRGLEDTWTLLGTDTTKLPVEQQTRLARKVALRTAYNAIEAATSLDAINAVTY